MTSDSKARTHRTRPPQHPQTPRSEWGVHRYPRDPAGEFFRQVRVAYAVMIPVGLVAGLSTGDADGAIVGALLGMFFIAGVAIGFTALLGLPLRLNQRLRRWWINNGEIAYAGIVISLGTILYACLNTHQETYMTEFGQTTGPRPDWIPLLIGWLMLAFFTTMPGSRHGGGRTHPCTRQTHHQPGAPNTRRIRHRSAGAKRRHPPLMLG